MDEETAGKVKEALSEMVGNVHIIVYTDGADCRHCEDVLGILKELCEMSPLLTFEERPEERGSEHGVDQFPAIVVMKGSKEENSYTGIRFFGVPGGYEFTSLLDSILTVSKGDELITPAVREELRALDKDIHIKVFVTPTCPYCPRAVILAHHLALYSDRIVADMIEATEFQDLAIKYQVMGVPKTIVNDRFTQEGAAPERMIMDLIRKASRA
ncbi:MAG: thioredoxin family protein [Candidatus Thermoplasmatota archaeon]|nr:thioredoxin family protein [Candidatus Thermoplasmatota archaeon]